MLFGHSCSFKVFRFHYVRAHCIHSWKCEKFLVILKTTTTTPYSGTFLSSPYTVPLEPQYSCPWYYWHRSISLRTSDGSQTDPYQGFFGPKGPVIVYTLCGWGRRENIFGFQKYFTQLGFEAFLSTNDCFITRLRAKLAKNLCYPTNFSSALTLTAVNDDRSFLKLETQM